MCSPKPVQAAALLRESLPAGLRDRLDWNTLRRFPGTLVDERLGQTETDLLFEVDQPGGEPSARVYVLIEHQSFPDRFMALRLLRYCVGVLEAAVREDPKRKRLPPILPMVFHQGRCPLSMATELRLLTAPEIALRGRRNLLVPRAPTTTQR